MYTRVYVHNNICMKPYGGSGVENLNKYIRSHGLSIIFVPPERNYIIYILLYSISYFITAFSLHCKPHI